MTDENKLTPFNIEEEDEFQIPSPSNEEPEVRSEESSGESESDAKGRNNKFDPKMAVRILSGLVIILLLVILGIRFIHRTQVKENTRFDDLITTVPDRAIPDETGQDVQRININTAPVSLLVSLPGIGEAKAQAIVDFRNENGPFTQPEDLLKIKGIGEKILDNIRPYIYFYDD